MKKGFTLVEVMVLVTIIAIIASIAVPNIAQYNDEQRIAEAKREIDSIVAGVNRFHTSIANYPSALSHLTDSITTSAGATITPATRKSCTGFTTSTGFYTNNQVTTWRNNAPYFSQPLTTSGYYINNLGTMNDALVRVPSSGANAATATLQFNVPGARYEDIADLDTLYDSPSSLGSALGSIRWSATVNGTATMSYVINITGC